MEAHVPTTLVWFRDDLRVTDNPALSWAASRGEVAGVLIDERPRSRRTATSKATGRVV
ncbi:deoxyribodipyrimidine photo-lyase [Corynebacterium pilbarense]|uniref:deoxyribodipyrimidine photo-lyase n=1 Tax=Corynebacterium pilbarense TaxID=1288393 RepID=UPI0036093BEB